jgi:hypothetical protein
VQPCRGRHETRPGLVRQHILLREDSREGRDPRLGRAMRPYKRPAVPRLQGRAAGLCRGAAAAGHRRRRRHHSPRRRPPVQPCRRSHGPRARHGREHALLWESAGKGRDPRLGRAVRPHKRPAVPRLQSWARVLCGAAPSRHRGGPPVQPRGSSRESRAGQHALLWEEGAGKGRDPRLGRAVRPHKRPAVSTCLPSAPPLRCGGHASARLRRRRRRALL